jgi:hypothetical protein
MLKTSLTSNCVNAFYLQEDLADDSCAHFYGLKENLNLSPVGRLFNSGLEQNHPEFNVSPKGGNSNVKRLTCYFGLCEDNRLLTLASHHDKASVKRPACFP